MALVSASSPAFLWPGNSIIGGVTNPSFSTRTTVDASGEYHAIVTQAQEDMSISHIGWYNGGVAGSPTADIRIETVTASTGLPSGTLWATNTNVVTGTLTANTWVVYALGATATILRGQLYAVKFLYNSGTSFNFVEYSSSGAIGISAALNTGTPSLATSGVMAPIGLGSSSTAMYLVPGLRPINGLSNTSFNNTSGGRRGVRFQVPFACRLRGVRFMKAIAQTGDFNFGVWDNGGTEVGSSITASDFSAFNGTNAGWHELMFDSAPSLSANTNYRVALEPTSSTNVNMYHMTAASNALFSGNPGGSTAHLTTYTTGGGWDDSATTTVPWFDLLLDQIHDGASSGGGASFSAYVS